MAVRLRTLLLAYALVVSATPMGFLFLQGQQDAEEHRRALEEEVAEDARRAATVQQRAVEDLGRALELLATLPAVAEPDPITCADMLETTAAARREVQALWRTDLDDRVQCSSRGLVSDLSTWPPVVAFRADPTQTLASHAIDPATGHAVLPMAVRLDDGGLLIGSLSVASIHQRMEALAGNGTHVLAIDASGLPVASNLDLAGHDALLAGIASGSAPLRYRTGGIERLYAAVPLSADGDPGSGLIVVGEPTAGLDAAIAADTSDRWWALGGIVVAAAAIAVLLAHVAFQRPLRGMVRAVSHRPSQGALQIPRVGLPVEWRELADALEEATASANRMERERQELLNHVAHQLRTPLTPLFLRLDVAKVALGAGDTPSLSKALDGMERPLEELAQKARKLDAVGGLLLGTRTAARARLPAAGILEDVAAIHTRRAATRRVRIEVVVPPELVLDADPGLLALGLSELLDNAVSAAPKGTEVQLVARREGAEWVIGVRDHGEGVPPDVLQRLLDPVWAWDVPGERMGLGVGVLIARMVAAAHQGRLEAEVTPEGTWFAIRLPAGER